MGKPIGKREMKKNTHHKTSRLKKPENRQLNHNQEKYLY
jgi:hypothetical protein